MICINKFIIQGRRSSLHPLLANEPSIEGFYITRFARECFLFDRDVLSLKSVLIWIKIYI